MIRKSLIDTVKNCVEFMPLSFQSPFYNHLKVARGGLRGIFHSRTNPPSPPLSKGGNGSSRRIIMLVTCLTGCTFLLSSIFSRPVLAQGHAGHTAPSTAVVEKQTVKPQAPQSAPPEEMTEETPQVEISSEQQQLIGVKTVKVSLKPIKKVIRTVGRIEADERKLATINTKVEGWIEKLYVDYTGRYVKKGEPLVERSAMSKSFSPGMTFIPKTAIFCVTNPLTGLYKVKVRTGLPVCSICLICFSDMSQSRSRCLAASSAASASLASMRLSVSSFFLSSGCFAHFKTPRNSCCVARSSGL